MIAASGTITPAGQQQLFHPNGEGGASAQMYEAG